MEGELLGCQAGLILSKLKKSNNKLILNLVTFVARNDFYRIWQVNRKCKQTAQLTAA